MTDIEVMVLKEAALIALDKIQMGSEDVEDFSAIYSVIRNLWVLATQFEEKSEFQLLGLMAKAALCYLIQHPEEKERVPFLAPVQHAVNAYYDQLMPLFTRADLIASMRVASDNFDTLMKTRTDRFYMANPDDTTDGIEDSLDAILRVRGFSYLLGGCVTGFMDKQDGRYVWVDPINCSIYPVNGPTLVYLADDVGDKIERIIRSITPA